jgi:hypothetical protein
MVEDFDVVEVAARQSWPCVEPEVCDSVVSGFDFVFPHGFDVLPLCLIGLGCLGGIYFHIVFCCPLV